MPREAAEFAKSVEPVGLYWLEDPTPAEDQDALKLLRQHSTVPIAIGEVFNSIWDCNRLIENELIDFIRVAVTYAGGITHVKRIVDLAACTTCAPASTARRATRRSAWPPRRT